MRLSVEAFKKKRARSSEHSFEKAFAVALGNCGLRNWHMSCREAGWPDRYVKGGIWVEIKSLKWLGKQSELSQDQVAKLNDLARAGDRCYYLAKWEDSFVLVPWAEFKNKEMKPINCTRYHYRTRADLEEAIRYVFELR